MEPKKGVDRHPHKPAGAHCDAKFLRETHRSRSTKHPTNANRESDLDQVVSHFLTEQSQSLRRCNAIISVQCFGVVMAPPAQWKGYSRVSCPIALYPAAFSCATIHFNQINNNTGHRIRMLTVDAQTGDPGGGEHAKNEKEDTAGAQRPAHKEAS
jgi:hypothetical protein